MADPNLQAFCRESKCVVIDVRVDTVSTCKVDTDCVLRAAECCPCGTVGEGGLVSVANSDEYGKQVCAPQQVCGKCAWVLPADKRAACDQATKHCVVANK